MYVAFHIIGELSPILKISELILPLFILLMLKGRELKAFILVDYGYLTFALVKNYGLLEYMSEFALVTGTAAGGNFTGLPDHYLILSLVAMFYGQQTLNYILAWHVIKKKKLRERIGV